MKMKKKNFSPSISFSFSLSSSSSLENYLLSSYLPRFRWLFLSLFTFFCLCRRRRIGFCFIFCYKLMMRVHFESATNEHRNNVLPSQQIPIDGNDDAHTSNRSRNKKGIFRWKSFKIMNENTIRFENKYCCESRTACDGTLVMRGCTDKYNGASNEIVIVWVYSLIAFQFRMWRQYAVVSSCALFVRYDYTDWTTKWNCMRMYVTNRESDRVDWIYTSIGKMII